MNVTVAKAEAAPAGERQRGVDRVIDIFEALLRAREPLRVGELARRLGAPRSSLYSLVNRLVAAELLEVNEEDGTVFLGRAMHLYGVAYGEVNPLGRRCRHVLDQLAAETGATAQLCALRGDKYVVLDSRGGAGPFRITADTGVPVPLPWTASGRLLLDHLSPEAIAALVPLQDFRLPDGRVVDGAEFRRDVARARADGHCITAGLSDRFTCCIAAPIRDKGGVAVATLCFVIPAEQPPARRSELAARLVAAARHVADQP